MKKKIIILGSTGSIGKQTINILKKDKKKFDIKLLSTNTNILLVMKQAKLFNVKNIIITDKSKFNLAKKKFYKKKINFYNNFKILDNLFKKNEIYYSMISIVGIEGLIPTIKSIRFSKNIGIINKESLVCGWSIIKRELDYYKTNFIPLDSEHFSIKSIYNRDDKNNLKKIYITASGGPFLDKLNINKKKITIKQALSHPNWIMGKKISIDSATMMNKVFEVIEAKNIFNLNYNQISILIHPKSYVHSLIEFKNGLIKIIAHKPVMTIPIKNSLYSYDVKLINKPMNLETLNNLNLRYINSSQFPLVKILNKLPKFNSFYETALVCINDFFVNLFLKKKINFDELINNINKFAFKKEILRFRKIPVKNVDQINKFRNNLSLILN